MELVELDLYRFIHDNGIEMRWDCDILSAWIPFWGLQEFTDLISGTLYGGGIDSRLQRDGIWVDLVPICEYYDIDPQRIFLKIGL